MIKTSLIIPLFNEEKNIPVLIEMLTNQTLYPNEIIFINAGSTDLTKKILNNEIDKSKLNKDSIIIKNTNKLYPGAARNAGIKLSKFEYILFIDAGIKIDERWVEKSIKVMNAKKYDIIWGACKFSFVDNFSEALCAITFGKDKTYQTIPGSIINRKTFDIIGDFDPKLLSAEDLLWMNKANKSNFNCFINNLNFNTYSSYPDSFLKLSKKWFINSFFSIKSKLYFKQSIIYTVFFLSLFLSPLISYKYLGLLFLFYFIFRILILPIKKNKKIIWYSNVNVFFYSLIISVIIDFSKFFGFITGAFFYGKK